MQVSKERMGEMRQVSFHHNPKDNIYRKITTDQNIASKHTNRLVSNNL